MSKIKHYIKLFYAIKFFILSKIVNKIAFHDKSLDNMEWSIAVWEGIIDSLLLLFIVFLFFPLANIQDNKQVINIMGGVIILKFLIENIYWFWNHKWLDLVRSIENLSNEKKETIIKNTKRAFIVFLVLLFILMTFRIATAPDFS